MATSFSQRVDLQCPECSTRFSAEVWLIVDLLERPDLAAQCRDGKIRAVVCPQGHAGTLGTPLLVHDPARRKLFLALTPNVPQDQAHALNAQLVARLRQSLPVGLPFEYLNETQVVPLEFLPAALSDDPQAALAEQLARHLPPLMRTLQEFIQADSWDESKKILETHPALLTDDADLLLAQMIDAAREQKDADAEKMFADHRDLLQRARRDGIDATFADLHPALPLAGGGL
ncbi:MAG: CpXC domain-containing protein, partial [Chloroflexota bacterium]